MAILDSSGPRTEPGRKDWTRSVMIPAMFRGALIGLVVGMAAVCLFGPFRHWEDYCFFPAGGTLLGLLLRRSQIAAIWPSVCSINSRGLRSMP